MRIVCIIPIFSSYNQMEFAAADEQCIRGRQ